MLTQGQTQGQRWLLGCWFWLLAVQRSLQGRSAAEPCGMTVADGCWLLAVGAEAEPERLPQVQHPFLQHTREKGVSALC